MSKYERRAREEERKRRGQEWEDLQEQKENEAIDIEDLKQQEDMKQGNYLESKSFEIDPNRKTPTEREKQREDRLRQRAGSGQQGADIAKKKLPKSKQTDLPQFLQSAEMDEVYAKDAAANSEFDRLVEEARGLTGRAKAAKLKQAARVRDGNTGMPISEVPGAVWGVGMSYAQSMMDPRAISEHFTDLAMDFKAFKKGAKVGAAAGFLIPDGPLMVGGETAGALVGGTAAVVTRRVGKKAIKEILSWPLDAGRRFFFGDEVVDAATGMTMRIDNADDFTSAKPLMSRSANPPDGSINLGSSGKPIRNTGGNPYLTYGERKGISPLPSEEEVIRRQKLGSDWQNLDASTLDPSQTRNWARYERDEAAYFLEERWPRDKEFNELGDLIKEELKTLYPDIPLSSWRRHHTNPLKQGAQLLNGLKPQYRKEAVQIMFGEGLSAGHNPEQLALIPHKIHTQIHNFINKRIGKDTVAKLEKKWLKPGEKLQDVPWPEREKIIMDYAKTVKESNEKIYDMMTAIAVNKKHGPNVLPEVLAELNSKIDAKDVRLDDLLKEIKLELNLQDIVGTVPKIDVVQLAQQWMDDPVKKKVLQAKMDGATRKQLEKEFGKNLNVDPDLFKQLDIFDQMTPQQYQMLQNRYKRGGKGSIPQ